MTDENDLKRQIRLLSAAVPRPIRLRDAAARVVTALPAAPCTR